MSEWLALTEVAARTGLDDRPVAWRRGELVRRAQFLADVARWQAAFAARPGQRVALHFDDGYEFAAALYGAWHAGKQVFLPGDTQPATLQRLVPQVDACAGSLPGALQPAASAQGPQADWPPLDPRATRLVVYTSGSSGEPVAIHKQLAQLDAEIHTQQAVFGARVDADGPACVHATVSHQHIYGLLFYTLWPLAAGRPFVAERIVYPEEMAARLGGRPTVLVTSPAHLKRLPDTLDWRAAREGLRAVFSSGGPLPPEASADALALMGHSPVEVFGSSETGGIAWRQRAVHGDGWNPLPGVEWRIEDELLEVRSPHMADDAWWRTADRVRPLDSGGFALLGRSDRIVKIEEKRVSLTAMEAALAACDEVAEARAVLLTNPDHQRLGMVVVPSAGGWQLLRERGKRALNERLRSALLRSVERIALPRHWRYVPALPVNPQGKSTEALLSVLFRPSMPAVAWQRREPREAEALLDITPDLLVFDGHFEQAAILPGVAQLDWAVELAKGCFALPPKFARADALKFQKPVLPGTALRLALQWNGETGVLAFQYTSDAGAHASGRIVFTGE